MGRHVDHAGVKGNGPSDKACDTFRRFLSKEKHQASTNFEPLHMFRQCRLNFTFLL